MGKSPQDNAPVIGQWWENFGSICPNDTGNSSPKYVLSCHFQMTVLHVFSLRIRVRCVLSELNRIVSGVCCGRIVNQH